MNHRRIKKLPTRAGKEPDAGPIMGKSLDFVDLASSHRVQESKKEMETLARRDRLEALRSERLAAEAANTAGESGAQDADADADAEGVELFEVKQREHRVFSTPVQDEIASSNARRIQWLERGGWFAAIGAVLVLIVLVGVHILRAIRDGGQSNVNAEAVVPEDGDKLAMNIAQRRSDSNQIAHKFAIAGSMAERLRHVRYPRRVAELMLQDKSMNWDASLPFVKIGSIDNPLIVDGRFFVGSYIEDEHSMVYPVFVETRQHGYLVDWGAYAEYNEVPWEVLVEERSSRRDYALRVVASMDDHYDHQFTEDEYTCFHIGNRNNSIGVFAYARKNGPVEEKLKECLRDTALESAPFFALRNLVQVRIRFHAGPSPRPTRPTAEITAFVAPHWFTLPPEPDALEVAEPPAIVGDDGEVVVPADVQAAD